jgi:MFS superfamily sulfate permease-like transporter
VPQSVLGAIICVAVLSLFDFHDMWRALWVAPVDFFVMIFTFLVTVLWNVELGLEYGIIASVVILLLQISKLDMDSLGQLRIGEEALLPSTLSKAETHIRPVDKYPAARQHPNVKVCTYEGAPVFG